MMHVFERRLRIPAPARQVFAWHEREDALQKLIPPGDPVRLVRHSGGIRDGAEVVLAVGYFPLQLNWVARHEAYVEGRQFRDVQVSGPFEKWAHTHLIIADGTDACILVDHVEYELPFGSVGEAVLGRIVKRKLEKMFAWRHQVTYRENTAPAL